MKNVTKILTAAVLCAALFASTQRTDALGGSAFWPGDEANIAAFPAQVNNHSYLQLTGVGCTTWDSDGNCTANDAGAGASLLIQKDGTTWGFNYGSDDWVNMSWGNGDMGVTVGMENTASSDGNSDKDGMSVSWGGSFGDIGEFGVHYGTEGGDDDATIDVDWRKDCGLWIFDNANVSLDNLMGGDDDDMMLDAKMFSHMDAGGATVMFGWGVGYNGGESSANSLTWDATDGCSDEDITVEDDCDDTVDVATLTQTAAIGVEADMTGWATLRAGYNWSHTLACDNGNDGDDACGDNAGSFMWGLGFNWGGLTADMTVDSGLFNDPIGAVTGRDEGGITNSTVTLTYSF